MGEQFKKIVSLFTTLTNNNDLVVGHEDRISSLPDDLIHHILLFSNARLAVQTSVLSKRWKFIWTTLPYVNFTTRVYDCRTYNKEFDVMFVDKFLCYRNNKTELLELKLGLFFGAALILVDKFVSYAALHNVQDITVDIMVNSYEEIKSSVFSSKTTKRLKLKIHRGRLSKSDCWDLPALTSLHLTNYSKITLPESCLICLHSLRTLFLGWCNLPDSISLPAVTTLYLKSCQVPAKSCQFPALTTLTLVNVAFPEDTRDFFHALVNLQNLKVEVVHSVMADRVINCPQLVNLETVACTSPITSHRGKIIVSSPRILNFSSVGFFPITFEVPESVNVNIKLRDITGYKTIPPPEDLKKSYHQFIDMFSGLGSARVLTLDLKTIEALSAALDFLACSPPFHNLKYVKVPLGYEEASMPIHLKHYLLGKSPRATIVTTLSQDELIPHTLPSLRDQSVARIAIGDSSCMGR